MLSPWETCAHRGCRGLSCQPNILIGVRALVGVEVPGVKVQWHIVRDAVIEKAFAVPPSPEGFQVASPPTLSVGSTDFKANAVFAYKE